MAQTYDVPWKTSCWGICAHHACCLSICCPCTLYYKTSTLLAENGEKAACFESILGCCCFFGGYSQRVMLRNKYNLQGSVVGDFLVHMCCQCVALGLVYREAEAWRFEPPYEPAAPPEPGPDPDQAAALEPGRVAQAVSKTPTDRYRELLTDLNALDNPHLGKRSSKTSQDLTDTNLGSIVIRGDSFGSHGAKETELALMSVSSKALELHRGFADEEIDSSKLLGNFSRSNQPEHSEAEQASTSGTSTPPPGQSSRQTGNTPPPQQPANACPETEQQAEGLSAESVARLKVGKLVKTGGETGHYELRQPHSVGEKGGVVIGARRSLDPVKPANSPPLVKTGSMVVPPRVSSAKPNEKSS